MNEHEPTSTRRRVLRAAAVGLAAATAGCAVEVGDYRIGVDETGESTPTATETASPTGTADGETTATETASPTATADGEATATETQSTPTDSPDDPDAIPVSDLSAGDLVVTEVMVDPHAASDDAGEWFEAYNARAEPVDLAGLVVTDEVADDRHTVSGSLVVPPGGYVVFVVSQPGAEAAGFAADYVYDGVQLRDGSDELLLTTGSVVVDAVSWSTSTEGYSRTLDPRYRDAAANDDPTYWCDAVRQLPGGDFGTPGEPNSRC